MTTHSHADNSHGAFTHLAHAEKHTTGSSTAVKDPVCGMTVTVQSLHRSEHMGHSFFLRPQVQSEV